MAKVDRSILAANDQKIGEFGNPDKLESSITHLADKIDENDTDITVLKTDNSSNKGRLNTLESDVSTLKSDNTSNKSRIAENENDIAYTDARVTDILRKNPQPSEVVDARLGFPVLRNKLESIDSQLADVMQVNFNKYGSTANADNTPALQSIISEAVSKGYTSVEITVPRGVYKFTTPLVDTSNLILIFKGKGRFSSVFLWRGGAGTFITNNGTNDWYFKDMQITGWQTGDAAYFTTGSTGLRSKVNWVLENVYLQGFATLIYWDGGFYHQFNKCRFEKANKVMDNAYANNLIFQECRALRIDNFVVASAGNGPFVAIGCALEMWTSTLFSTTSGAMPQIVLVGNYIENYPNVAAGNGLAKAYYDTAFVASGFGGYTLLGNTFTTGGIRRIVNNSGMNTDNITSLGNRIDYSGTANDSLEYAFMFANLKSAQLNDYAKNILPGTGTYASKYAFGTYANPENCKLFDPFTNKEVSPEIPWINATLLNGWVQNATAGNNTVAYRMIGNTIHLKGVIDGGAATANAMFNIPGLTITKTNWRNTGAVGSAGNFNTRILSTGDVRCETMGTNGIILDGLRFDIL